MLRPPYLAPSVEAWTDWLEATLIASDDNYISFAEIRSTLLGDSTLDIDDTLSNLRRKVRSRGTAMGSAYPVGVTSSGFELQGEWEEYLAYSFLLLVSLNQSYAELRFGGSQSSRPAFLFEMLSCEALSRQLSCNSFRFGAPRRLPVPASFGKAIDFLASAIGEERGTEVFVGGNEKDDGLDIVGWRPFRDERTGKLIIIGQCTIGTNWEDKVSELHGGIWRGHMRWDPSPMRAFFVPFEHSSDATWRRNSAIAGIIFDRIRIAHAASEAPRISTFLHNGLCNWSRRRVMEIREKLSETDVSSRAVRRRNVSSARRQK